MGFMLFNQGIINDVSYALARFHYIMHLEIDIVYLDGQINTTNRRNRKAIHKR